MAGNLWLNFLILRPSALFLTTPATYDYIIAGAGAAGLSLAWQLTHSQQLRHKQMLLLDQDPKTQNDRTWGYWAKRPEPFDALASWQFQQAEFFSQSFSALLPLHPYTYRVLEGNRFYAAVREWLRQFPNVHWRQEAVQQLQPTENAARVETSAGVYEAEYVFNSCFLRPTLEKITNQHLNLKQHFKGWVIETEEPVFAPERLRLFDFRTPQAGSLRFFYLIPHSPYRALVEYTLFSGELLAPQAYVQALQVYVQQVLGIQRYKVVEEEWGVIPMTTFPFPKHVGRRIINIGSVGGASKPSTGYTFRRIQQQCQELVQLLEKGELPLPAGSAWRHRLYDAALLNILDKKGERGEQVFARLFQRNPVERLLKFLDEETHPGEEFMLMQTVDKPLFTGSLLNAATSLFPFR